MRIIADLHIHSHYSRATSPKLTLPYLERWARIKGIDLVGTGDCTHPAWLAELREELEPAEEGFFKFKPALRREFDSGEALAEGLPEPPGDRPVRFVLTGEISTIYSRGGRTRKVHHVVILPDFAAAAAFQTRLERMGNISSDGRPILGVDSRDLFAALLDADERSILVPAHIWTPWFSALGANSGFDSIEECYGDLTSRIGAIETGLSSNPPMNWAVSSLDRFGIISNSDAHSPEKLGREATVFDMEHSFAGLAEALSGGGPAGRIVETVEFFPQEGKYHYDGHRACGVVLSPAESLALRGRCPVCGKPLTPGVMRRVAELADRPVDETAPCPRDYADTNRRPYRSLIPLPELLAELLGTGSGSKKVAAAYGALVKREGSEFSLLLDRSGSEIESMGTSGVSGELLAMAIGRMRSGQVSIKPGYDGEYGVIHAFAPGERIGPKAEAGLFDDETGAGGEKDGAPAGAPKTPEQTQRPPEQSATEKGEASSAPSTPTSVPATRRRPHAEMRSPEPRTATNIDNAEPQGGGRATAGAAEAAGTSATSGAAEAESAAGLRAAESRAEVGAAGQGAPNPVPAAPAAFSLDAAQESAVNHPGGPALIVAGPGTGKTAVLALRIARLVEGGLDPSSILAITFTNKAAAELRERIQRTIGKERAARLTAATFHAFCLSVLREHAAEVSLPPDFVILDEEEREAFLKSAAAPAKGGAGRGRQKLRRLASYIEERKRFLLLPGDRMPRLGPAAPGGLAELATELGVPPFDADLDAAYAHYRNELREAHALDFDDLVAGTVRRLAARPEMLSAYRSRFRSVFVDEYQDVNFAQYALIRLLAPAADSTDLCVIGDPNQAIYGFRGSDRRFIERFLADYPDAAVYRLARSFRCAQGIIGAAGRLVGAELGGSGAAVALSRCEFPTEASEAEGIAREIDRLIGGTRFFAIDSGVAGFSRDTHNASQEGQTLSSLGECAILIRAAALAPPIEKALLDHGIPYRFIGERPWWEEEPVRSVLSLVRAAVRPDTQTGRGHVAGGAEIGNIAGGARPAGGHNIPQQLVPAEEALRARLSGLSPVEAVRAAIDLLGGETSDATVKTSKPAALAGPESSLERLVVQASLYPDLASFLDDLALGSPQDGYEAHGECVSLMTMHAAKGLEFDYVFVAGLEEGLLPFTLFEGRDCARKKGKNSKDDSAVGSHTANRVSLSSRETIEEERRLLYVAMTRARVGLYLSWARSRHFLGRKLSLAPSRFLARIEDLVPMVERSAPKKPKDSQPELF
jgi:DNA helicase-2/ATP-dependent DNA helicase PcrA